MTSSPRTSPQLARHSNDAADIAQDERAIQAKIDATDRDGEKPSDRAPQTGARNYPVPPLPKQHQAKPGSERTKWQL